MMPSKHLLLTLFVIILLPSSTFIVHGAKNDVKVLQPPEVAKEAAVAAQDAALMGKLLPLISNLFARKGGLSFQQVFKAVTDLVDERELAVFAIAGWGLVPFTQSIYEMIHAKGISRIVDDDEEEEMLDDKRNVSKFREAYEYMTPWRYQSKNCIQQIRGGADRITITEATGKQQKHKVVVPFKETFAYQSVELISQSSKIGLSVIAVDVVSMISRVMGYNPWNIMEKISRIFSKVAYTGLITLRLCVLKRYLLAKAFGKFRESDEGKMNVIDNLVDGVFYLVGMFYLLNYLEVYTGIAIKSLFSIGATGTLVFGLASKDVASQIIGGLTLHLSDKIFVGDDVRFYDGTQGKIEKMGWFETMIRNSDELVVGIPNTQVRALCTVYCVLMIVVGR
mmetsp:Transcript_15825/g.34087  ORF Transcript_15825/g.34087 Transcript_15825/m.34087 type:complete len:394 (+) Transcript_15825:57-1238(+)